MSKKCKYIIAPMGLRVNGLRQAWGREELLFFLYAHTYIGYA